MKNFAEKGETITIAAPAGGVVSGQLVIVADIVGVAQTTQAAGVDVALAVQGVFVLPKAAVAIGTGVKVYWDPIAKNVTTATAGNILIGRAWASAIAGGATVAVKITPVN